MKKLLIVLCLLITACTASVDVSETPGMLECQADVDCICGGVVQETGECFVGNEQWAQDKVDFSRACPDFCTGIAGNMETKCVSGECKVVQKGTAPQNTQCKTDDDCIVTGCSGHLCAVRKKIEQEPIFTTCEYKPEYECVKLSTCGCFFGTCRWDQTQDYVSCIQKYQK